MKISKLSLGLISPERVHELSYGEVTMDKYIHHRSKREPAGSVDNNASAEGFVYGSLFCERIFGPVTDYTCGCHKYKGDRSKEHTVCSHCGVPIEKSSVRGERMGHIELAVPVCHPWFLKSGTSSTIAMLLGVSTKNVIAVANYDMFMVLDPKKTPLEKYQFLTYDAYNLMREKYDDFDDNSIQFGVPEHSFECGTGGNILYEALKAFDLEKEKADIEHKITLTKSASTIADLTKRLNLIDSFIKSGNKPEWMMLTALPVLPPNLRPVSKLNDGVYATSDINELYRGVIKANNRIKGVMDGVVPAVILYSMCRELQQSVIRLFDNHKISKPAMSRGIGGAKRAYKSLAAGICGKHGRFRQNLLGKRVDYSGRSVIVVGPELKMYQCGLPKEMAIELFAPFVVHRYIEIVKADGGEELSIKAAKRILERRGDDRLWDALEEVIKGKCVLLNRAPTLHRLGIQAFEPVLVEGHAIKLHPLVCTGFNADFDGDQMAVHVPLSDMAQEEAHKLMLATKNLLKPSDGKPVATPSQDMVLGIYYLSMPTSDTECKGVYSSPAEAEMAYANKVIDLHNKIKIRYNGKLLDCTLGQFKLNSVIPQDLGYGSGDGMDIKFHVKKKELGKIIDKCIEIHGSERATQMLDDLKALGYKYSTQAAITVSAFDVLIPEAKKTILEEADNKVDVIRKYYNRGFMSEGEKSKKVVDIWNKATDDVTTALQDNLPHDNPIYMMADSGARGSIAQIRQLAGMRGLIANTSGAVIETPIKRNYSEGLTVLDYFVSSRGARKGMADTALRTANSGYLTRRLVDVSQDVITTCRDCGSTEGIKVSTIRHGTELVEDISERLIGRYLVNDFVLPNGEVISKDKLLDKVDVEKLLATGTDEFEIRSVLHCHAHHGVCCKCYGADLSTSRLVKTGVAVGVIAAQSIGEPGTQLTMRTFHTGGIASTEDITQGLPRVEEIFENRGSEKMATLAPFDGTVEMHNERGNYVVTITSDNGDNEVYRFKQGNKMLVTNGGRVKKGDKLNNGMLHSSEILRVWGKAETEAFIISEIQRTYRLQGVDINDKHVEMIIRQMFSKVYIVDAETSDFVNGTLVQRGKVFEYNTDIEKRIANGETGLKPIIYRDEIRGIQRVAKSSDSFLSAASFQETEQVLVNAALRGAVDNLEGLKENVILGNLIPSGTGYAAHVK